MATTTHSIPQTESTFDWDSRPNTYDAAAEAAGYEGDGDEPAELAAIRQTEAAVLADLYAAGKVGVEEIGLDAIRLHYRGEVAEYRGGAIRDGSDYRDPFVATLAVQFRDRVIAGR